MRTLDYMEKLRRKTKRGSDYAIAKLLEVTPEAVHGYVKKGRTMDNTTAARAAAILGVPVLRAIADMEIERARNADSVAYWTALCKTMRKNRTCPLCVNREGCKTARPKRQAELAI